MYIIIMQLTEYSLQLIIHFCNIDIGLSEMDTLLVHVFSTFQEEFSYNSQEYISVS